MMPDLARTRGSAVDVTGPGCPGTPSTGRRSDRRTGPARAPGRCSPGSPPSVYRRSGPFQRSSAARGAGVSAITSELARLSGPLAYLVVAALVFGETALFFGFVLPGEIAVVLGGVLASRGRVSLPL